VVDQFEDSYHEGHKGTLRNAAEAAFVILSVLRGQLIFAPSEFADRDACGTSVVCCSSLSGECPWLPLSANPFGAEPESSCFIF
jgi:hypothetical protein